MTNFAGFETASPTGPVPRAFSVPWALQAACTLDAYAPNFFAHIVCSSDCRRQAIFAALSELRYDHPDALASRLRPFDSADCAALDPLARIANALILSKPREIIQAVFGEVPDGLMGSIARLGSEPLADRSLYRELFDLFAQPWHERRADLIRQTQGDHQ